MEQERLIQLQSEASQAYERLPQPESAHNAQVVMLAEIALQLAKVNEHLSKLANPPIYASADEAMQAYLAEQQYKKENG